MHKLASAFGKAAMVVKKAIINEQAECQVMIVARQAGLGAWLMSLLGIDSTFTLSVYRDRIESEEGSLSGRVRTIIPLSALDTYTNGYTKPFINLIFGLSFIVLGLIFGIKAHSTAILFILLVSGAVCIIAYLLKKCLIMDFTTIGANGIFFLFKRSVIEGVAVDEDFANTVCEIVKVNYLKQVART